MPLPQGAPHHPMVEAVEAVVMMTMAAALGTAMEVETVIPAVGVTSIPLTVASGWEGRIGAPPPLGIEATPLVTRMAVQAVEGHVEAVVAVELTGDWLAADTKPDLEITIKKTLVFIFTKQPWLANVEKGPSLTCVKSFQIIFLFFLMCVF